MMVAIGLLALLIGVAPPQNTASSQASKNGPVTLDGCVAASQTVRNTFTLDDDGRTFLLKGVNVRDFVGKHVEVIGSLPKRLTIVGGLYPSANVAGQAGAIDPGKAAIAAQSGPTSQSERPAIEFTVKSVRVLSDTCETPK